MYVNHDDVGWIGDFTKEGCTTQHIHHTTYHRDSMPHKELSSYEPNPHPTTSTTPLLEE